MLMLIVSFVVISTPAFASNPPDVPHNAIYDINDDGVFNSADLDLLNICYGHKRGQNGWRCYVGAKPIGAPWYRGDLNFDGKCDSKDLKIFKNKYIHWYEINGWWK